MRDFTEAPANHVVLSIERLPRLLDDDNVPPIEFLPPFLHESTHHWCFSPPSTRRSSCSTCAPGSN
ncbi:hypothetical protein CLV68_3186 [Actinokineospora cianjurensis]|uniref:Uncharacterized protein n=1 Tax=Actinokineospora cianjurensis TaxID=585224 RepID=A0A421B2T5_9PSEU|nr:hypothetical protein CLV68_3186 [Actinokineospora cianjurensis]